MKTNRTTLQKELNFTKEQGLSIQAEQLEAWKRVLKPEAFEMLEKLATAQNNEAQDGFDVVRGTSIDEILQNEVMLAFFAKNN